MDDSSTSSSRESFNDDSNKDSDPESPTIEDLEAHNKKVQAECVEKFSTPDFIMEPDIFNQLKRFFQSGGDPEKVINLLSENYQAIAQTANLLAEWLITAGMEVSEVQALVEDHLKKVIIKHFDPKRADAIFTEGGTPVWLSEMIEHPTWRTLIYKLAEDHPDCVMLNFTIKLISDKGYQHEITNISTASQQLEVFSRILKSSVSSFLQGGQEKLRKTANEFTKMVCHGEHTYLYSQALLHVLSREPKGGSNIKRLSQEVSAYVQGKKQNATSIDMTLTGATNVPRACQALSAMLSKNTLNPADITVLYKMYQVESETPPVELIRVPQFLDLLMDSLFKPGSKVNSEHKPKYIFLLAYAVSVYEIYKRGTRKSINKEELKTTTQAIEKVHKICNEKKGSSELLPELNTLFQCIRFPVIALGIVRWVDTIVSEKSYFNLSTEHTPLHLVLLDEVCTCHSNLHQKILELLVRLFESPQEDLGVLVQLERKKMLLDRMVHLFSCGCAIPVLSYIRTCWQRQDTDISLIRYFVTEVLDIIAPPYTSEFVNLLLPLVENKEITGMMRSGAGDNPVLEFIKQCKSN